MNHLTDILRAERIVRQERDREHIRNAMAALEAWHRRPDDLDLRLWALEEIHTLIGCDDLHAEIEDQRHQLSECESCHKNNCICDVRFEERRNDGWNRVEL